MRETRGEVFKVGFTLQTQATSYAVLINGRRSLYFPIATTSIHNAFIDKFRSDGMEGVSLESFGFFSFISKMWKAHGITPSQIAIELDDPAAIQPKLACYIELCQSSEIGLLMSRTDTLLPDATVLSVMSDIPFTIYATDMIPIAFSVDMNKAKDGNIMASIRDDIMRMESGKVP